MSTPDAVLRALDLLTRDQRTAVVLRYYAHLSEHQMAAVLGVADGTVKSRLARALKNLADDPPAGRTARTPMTDQNLTDLLERAGERTHVGPPPVDRMVAGARRKRRRRAVLLTVVTAAGVAAAVMEPRCSRCPVATRRAR